MDTTIIDYARSFSSSGVCGGRWPDGRDEELSRLGAVFADLDAALLTGARPPGLANRDSLLALWRTAVRNASPIRARTPKGRRVKAVMLLAIIRQTADANSPLCDMARSIATDLAGRPGRKKRQLSSAESKILLLQRSGLSRRAAKALSALGGDAADDVLKINPADLGIHRNCGEVTTAELRAFVEARRRLQARPPR
jgi:hypothetical protein